MFPESGFLQVFASKKISMMLHHWNFTMNPVAVSLYIV